MVNMDDDLQDLFDQLDNNDVQAPADKSSSVKETGNVGNGAPTALKPIEDIPSTLNSPIISEQPPTVDIAKYLDKMEVVSDEVLQACRSDRAEAQEVINMLRGQCDEAHSKNHPPARMYVDGLVKAVEVKANINTNAVKVMEGVAKMIAATRSSLNINNNTLNVSTTELDEILNGPVSTEELD